MILFAALAGPCVADPSVAVRMIVNRGRSIEDACTEAEQGILVDTSYGGVAHHRNVGSPSWCQLYCDDFHRTSCWLAHPACKDSAENGAPVLKLNDEQMGTLSEMELLIPDLNDSELGDFNPAMRESCKTQRDLALQAVNSLVPLDTVSQKCRNALKKRIIADCVLVPQEVSTAE